MNLINLLLYLRYLAVLSLNVKPISNIKAELINENINRIRLYR
jgi:hypothetical protein